MTEESNPTEYLGLEITRTPDTLKLKQVEYVNSLVEKYGVKDCKPMRTPMISDNTKDLSCSDKTYPYRETIGSLLYLSNRTRPDIAYAVNYCSRKMEEPTSKDVTNLKRILKYMNTYSDEGIEYRRNSNISELEAYCDSDYAGDLESRKSTSGYVIYYCGGPIVWCSRKQPIVALSSTEAEYIAAAECTKELLYIKTLIEELQSVNVNINLHIDNQSALTMIKNGQINRRSKHIDVRYHFIHEKISEGLIQIDYCCSQDNCADILTKPLELNKFNKIKSKLLC